MTTAYADSSPEPSFNAASRRLAELCPSQPNPALEGFADSIQTMLAPVGRRMVEQLLADVLPDINRQTEELVRSALEPLDTTWMDRITDTLHVPALGMAARRDLLDMLNQFDAIAHANPDLDQLVLDGSDADLGELGEEGIAFAAVEGAGLSWDVQRRLFMAFVFVAAFGLLMTAIVSSETASGLLEDGAVPASVATALMVAANRVWAKAVPQPADNDDDVAE
ncbi:hypothetical protein [[Kitasatospora] papulosa]|jgi:hypothetical protein|uniref:hypothetical protein n=1 Tax=[Kitasatospora] papulosa TaxID=1464011 RepID=UPI0036AFC9CE